NGMETLRELEERRTHELRLTPDRALRSPDATAAFLRERGLLTRTPDSALPSFFGACHEEPYLAGRGGFAEWPATKYPWYFHLAKRAGAHELWIHNGKSILLTDETLALADSILRAAVVAPEAEVARQWFSWRWLFEADLVDRLVAQGRLERPTPGFVTAPASG